jgi:hypothetical protein
MSPNTIKPWMTKLLALLMLVIGYLLHKGIVPPGYEIKIFGQGVSVAGVLTDILVALSALGISGPQLWKQAAAFLGNGPAQPPGPPAPPKV